MDAKANSTDTSTDPPLMPESNAFEPWTYEDLSKGPSTDKAYNLSSDAWNVPVNYWSAQEKEKCDAWKDEVQNLLIFAGLFSAVVTAFLVESYQSLQDNPSEVLLAQIATHLVAITNGTSSLTPTQSTVPFSPSSTSRRVNALWFLSLILSLATALVGIVAQQWLREHLRPSTRNVPPKVLTALLHMQAESLDRFFVPHIFTALPLLLITGLILFLVGMIEFLWDLNQFVAIPGTIAIAVIFAFLLYTTVRPGLQTMPGQRPRSPRTVPDVACPYKSPQSWAFLCLIAVGRFLSTRGIKLLRSALGLSSTDDPSIEMLWHLNHDHGCRSWISNGIQWLRQRDIDILSSRPDTSELVEKLLNPNYGRLSRYDSVNALLKIRETFRSTGSTELLDLYQCFREVTSYSDIEQTYAIEITEYIYRLVFPPPPTTGDFPNAFVLFVQQPDISLPLALMVDFMRLSFMDVPDVKPTQHQLLMSVRFLGWTLTNMEAGCDVPVGAESTCVNWPSGFFAFQFSNDTDELGLQAQHQIFHILETFFSRSLAFKPSHDEFGKQLFTTGYVGTLLSVVGRWLSKTNSEELKARHRALLSRIGDQILDDSASDYLFVTAACYAWNIMNSPIQHEGLFRALASRSPRFKDTVISALLNSILTFAETFFFPIFEDDLSRTFNTDTADNTDEVVDEPVKKVGEDEGMLEDVVLNQLTLPLNNQNLATIVDILPSSS